MLVQEPIKKIQLIQDSFSPSQVRGIVNSILDSYIQSYNLEYMRNWEANHNFDSKSINKKIELLKSLKQDLEDSISKADAERVMLKMEGLLDLKIAS